MCLYIRSSKAFICQFTLSLDQSLEFLFQEDIAN